MPSSCAAPILLALFSLATEATASAQQPPATRHFVQLRYPRDKERVVAMVDDLPIQLEDVVARIDERHYPGFRQLLLGDSGKGSPDGARILASDLIAPWVRQLADIRALHATALERTGRGGAPIDQELLEAAMSAALKLGFEAHLAAYTETLQQRGIEPVLDQNRVDRLLADFQLRNGLACELQGWLDFLEPLQEWTGPELNDFFQSHARVFGGGVTMAHILVQNRDAGTGILLAPEAHARAAARLAEIKARLLPDGSNFEDIARLCSEDTKTAPDGGIFTGVERFDYRLPPALCRKVWTMRDGEVSDVVETPYGWHLLKRIEHEQLRLMLFTPAAHETVRNAMMRLRQEDLLFGARERHRVRLLL